MQKHGKDNKSGKSFVAFWKKDPFHEMMNEKRTPDINPRQGPNPVNPFKYQDRSSKSLKQPYLCLGF